MGVSRPVSSPLTVDRKAQLVCAPAPSPGTCFIPVDPAARNIPFGGKLKVTQAICWIDISLFTASIVVGGFVSWRENPMLGPSVETLVTMGAMSQSLVQNGQAWRIVWAAYLHAGLIHLLINLIAWIGLGVMIEPDWGAIRTSIVFVGAAISGNLLSVTLDADNVSLGSSGGIFGLMAGLTIYIIEYWKSIPMARLMLAVVVICAVLSVASSFVPFVDAYAHMGGCAGGLLLSAGTIRRFGPRRSDVGGEEQAREMGDPFQSVGDSPTSMPMERQETEEIVFGGCEDTARVSEILLSDREASSVCITPAQSRRATQSTQLVTSPAAALIKVTHAGSRSAASRWMRKRDPVTHFVFAGASTQESAVVINPAASRMSIRKTLRTHTDRFGDTNSKTIWFTRITSLAILTGGWATMLYFIFLCKDCYSPPGQILRKEPSR